MNKWTPESRAKLRVSLTGRTFTQGHKDAIARNNAKVWLGKKMPDSARQKMSAAAKGRTPWNKGLRGAYKMPAEAVEVMRQRMIGARVGSKSPHWKGGVSPIRVRLWMSHKYKAWRTRIFEQDDYTCRFCGVKSGNGVAIKLEADHHPIPFVIYLDRLREAHGVNALYAAAMADDALWAAEGRTLCRPCHNTTKRGRVTKKEHVQ